MQNRHYSLAPLHGATKTMGEVDTKNTRDENYSDIYQDSSGEPVPAGSNFDILKRQNQINPKSDFHQQPKKYDFCGDKRKQKTAPNQKRHRKSGVEDPLQTPERKK